MNSQSQKELRSERSAYTNSATSAKNDSSRVYRQKSLVSIIPTKSNIRTLKPLRIPKLCYNSAMFEADFQSILLAPMRIFLMAAAGYFFVKARIVPEDVLDALNNILVCLFLPCMIAYEFLTKFTFAAYGNWWVFPLLGVGVSLAGLFIAEIFIFALKKKETKNEFLSLCAFQNSGYVPLLIAEVILPPAQAAEMFMYVFLFLVGFNFLVWSLGANLIRGKSRFAMRWEDLYNPPLVATALSLVVVFFGLNRFIPDFTMGVVQSFGACTMPVAMFVVGGSLAMIKIGDDTFKQEITATVLFKLFLFPFLTLVLLWALKIRSLWGLLLMIQAAAPSAVTLTVIAKYYKKDERFINQAVFYTHVIGLVSFPIFLILYQRLAG